MPKKKPNPVGRPSDFEPIYCEMLVKHMGDGKSFESFGKLAKCSKQTLYDWCKAHPQFLDAKQQGESACLDWWEEQSIKGLYNEAFRDDDGMTVTRSINSTVFRMNMVNRFGWRDKPKEDEESSKTYVAVPLTAAVLKKAKEKK